MRRTVRRALWGPIAVLSASALVAACSSSSTTNPPSGTSNPSGAMKKGLTVFVIPKNLGNPYFTLADSVKTGGALAALQTLGETGTETSGSAATASAQIPAI